MFNKNDFDSFWFSRNGFSSMYRLTADTERVDKNRYGSYPVPIVFFDSFDKRGTPTIISKTPFGKIIFPGPEITPGLETGVLYRDLRLRHAANHCITVGNDFRTWQYWKEVFNDRKIYAYKAYRNSSGCGLREAKDVVDKDWLIVWGPSSTNNTSNFSCGTNNQPSENQSVPPVDYQEKINDAVNSARHYLLITHNLERKVSHLEDELAKTLNRLSDEKEKNINQPQPTNNKFNFNVWEIIECKPDDDYNIIYSSVKKAIQLYHPDKVNRCGVLLQEISNEITSQLLLFRKQLRR